MLSCALRMYSIMFHLQAQSCSSSACSRVASVTRLSHAHLPADYVAVSAAQHKFSFSDEAALACIDVSSFSVRSGHDHSTVWPATRRVLEHHMRASVVPIILE